jgi:hypothetical protein
MPDGPIDSTTEVRDGNALMHGHGPSTLHGFAPHETPLRDFVIDAVVRTQKLDTDEGFGLFVRRNAPDKYVGLRVTPGRIIAISAFDGEEQPIVVGPLADDMVLHPDRNRITVAAVGPSITLSLNSLVVTSVLIDPRFIDGYCGLLLEQRHERPVELAVEWCQIREVW